MLRTRMAPVAVVEPSFANWLNIEVRRFHARVTANRKLLLERPQANEAVKSGRWRRCRRIMQHTEPRRTAQTSSISGVLCLLAVRFED